MTKLEMPKIEIRQKDTIKKFQEVCTGLTIVAVYAIFWLLIGALGYRIFLWVF
jgi:hypothetical protein